jgi:hypothetical protein
MAQYSKRDIPPLADVAHQVCVEEWPILLQQVDEASRRFASVGARSDPASEQTHVDALFQRDHSGKNLFEYLVERRQDCVQIRGGQRLATRVKYDLQIACRHFTDFSDRHPPRSRQPLLELQL